MLAVQNIILTFSGYDVFVSIGMNRTPHADATDLSLLLLSLQSKDEGAVSVYKDYSTICRMSWSLKKVSFHNDLSLPEKSH